MGAKYLRTRTKKIDVALCIDSLLMGGQEQSLFLLAKHLKKHGIRPHVYALFPGHFQKDLEDENINISFGTHMRISFDRWGDKENQAAAGFRKLMKNDFIRKAIKVVITFASNNAVIAAREAGVPVIIERIDGSTIYDKITDKSQLSKIIAPSEYAREIISRQKEYFGCREKDIAVIRSGIQLEKYNKYRDLVTSRKAFRKQLSLLRELGLRESDYILGTVCRLTKQKNVDKIVQASYHLRSHYGLKNTKLLVIGPDFGELKCLKKKTKELGLQRDVLFLGQRTDIPSLLSIMHIFVLVPVLGEGVPYSLIEATASGIPFISTITGFIPDICRDNGILLGRVDPKKLAFHLSRLLHDRPLRLRMSQKDSALAKDFDIKDSAAQYARVIKETLRKTRKPEKQRIVLAIPAMAARGGSERRLEYLAEYFTSKKEKYELIVCIEFAYDPEYIAFLREKGITVNTFEAESAEYIASLKKKGIPANMFEVHPGQDAREMWRAFLDFFEPHIIFSFSNTKLPYLRFPGKRPFLVEMISGPDRLIPETKNKFDLLTATYKDMAEHLNKTVRIPKRKIRIIETGVNLNEFNMDNYDVKRIRKSLGLDQNTFVVGTTSNVRPIKDLRTFLKSIYLLKKRVNGNTKGVIIGYYKRFPEEKKKLDQYIRRMGMKNSILFLGHIRDVSKYISILDVFVLTSLAEGTSNAVLEAMAMKKPVVCTNVGGQKELIKDSSYLIPTENPDILADRLYTLYKNRKLRKKVGSANYKTARRYSVERFQRRIEKEVLSLSKD